MDATKTTVPTTGARLGQFLTLEGIDGAGKSSHIHWAASYLSDQGIEVVTTREPGGTPLGDQIRSLLLNTSMAPQRNACCYSPGEQSTWQKLSTLHWPAAHG
jgi:thymidylate kinase